MIGRFRDSDVLRQAAITAVAGVLIGISWSLRLWSPSDTSEMVLSLIAAVLCGGPIILGAIRGLLARQINVDELVALAIIAALIIGEYLTAATVGFIMVLGSLLETYTSSRARRAIEALVELTPDTARVIEGNDERVVPIKEVSPGQHVLVKPGENIPVDGMVVEGTASVNQATITGEPIPVDVSPTKTVYAGSFVEGGALTIQTMRAGEDSTVGKIVRLIKEAESHQARIVRSADAFAKWFTPAILMLAGAVWIWSGEFIRCVSVLVVGCPCALILATPTAVVAAMGRAAKRGLIIKGGRYLEAVAEVDGVVFDKTGTLTIGRPVVQRVNLFNGATAEQVLAWAGSVEQKSEHPFGRAIVEEAKARSVEMGPVTAFESSAGLGVTGVVAGSRIRVGRKEYVNVQTAGETDEDGNTVLWITRDNVCVGSIALDDRVRPSTASAIRELQDLGIASVELLSGDRAAAVRKLADEVQIESWRADLLPHEKVEHLRRLKTAGKKVMYVGDGVNDGPALATSYVGVAMGAGASPVALETAQIGILRPDVSEVPALIRLGRMTRRRIHENLLLFALAYNGIAIFLASAGVLSPIMAAITHNIGSVAVVLNSARLIRCNP